MIQAKRLFSALLFLQIGNVAANAGPPATGFVSINSRLLAMAACPSVVCQGKASTTDVKDEQLSRPKWTEDDESMGASWP